MEGRERDMKRWMLAGLGSLITGVIGIVSAPAGQAQPRVELTTDPPLAEVLPFKDPVTLDLAVVDENGQPLPNVTLDLQLMAPAPTPWLTSDFPVVEGTPLLDLQMTSASGQVQVQQVMPIRGNYQLQVQVSPQATNATTPAFEPFTETLMVTVPENPVKYRNLAILLAILFLAGLGGGWVIGSDQRTEDGEIAPQPVRLLLSGMALVAIALLFYISLTAERADAHSSHAGPLPDTTPALPPPPADITAKLNEGAIARVGQAIPLTVQVADAATGAPIQQAQLEVQAISEEYGLPMLAFAAQTNDQGEFTWEQQFVDGAPHRLRVRVSPAANGEAAFAPFQLTKIVEVEGVAPPLLVRLISLGYFTAVLALGTMLGYHLRRRLMPSVGS